MSTVRFLVGMHNKVWGGVGGGGWGRGELELELENFILQGL